MHTQTTRVYSLILLVAASVAAQPVSPASADNLAGKLRSQRLAFEAGQAQWNAYTPRERELVQAMQRESENLFIAIGKSCVFAFPQVVPFFVDMLGGQPGEEPFIQNWLVKHCELDRLNDQFDRNLAYTQSTLGIGTDIPRDPSYGWWRSLGPAERLLMQAVEHEVSLYAAAAGHRCVSPEAGKLLFQRIQPVLAQVPERRHSAVAYRLMVLCR